MKSRREAWGALERAARGGRVSLAADEAGWTVLFAQDGPRVDCISRAPTLTEATRDLIATLHRRGSHCECGALFGANHACTAYPSCAGIEMMGLEDEQ